MHNSRLADEVFVQITRELLVLHGFKSIRERRREVTHFLDAPNFIAVRVSLGKKRVTGVAVVDNTMPASVGKCVAAALSNVVLKSEVPSGMTVETYFTH